MGILQIRRESGPPTISANRDGQLYLGTVDGIIYISNNNVWTRVSRNLNSILASQTSSMLILSSSYSVTSLYSLRSKDVTDVSGIAITGSNIFTGNQIISQSSSKTEIGAFTSSFDGDVIISGSVYISNGLYATASNSLYATSASYALNGNDSYIFVTTGSNIFNGSQIITGSLLVNSGSFFVFNNGTVNGPLTIRSMNVNVSTPIIIGTSTTFFSSSYYDPISQNTLHPWAGSSSISQTLDLYISGNIVYAGRMDGLYKSSDFGLSWNRVFSTTCLSVYSSQSALFCGGWNSRMYKSSDFGNSWTTQSISPVSGTLFDIDSIDNTIFSCHDVLGLFKSIDGGNTWSSATSSAWTSKDAKVMQVSSSYIFVGTNSNDFYVSPDKGITWTNKKRSPINLGSDTSDILISGSVIFLAHRDGGIARSYDTGSTWTVINNGLLNTSVRALGMSESGVLFAGSEGPRVAYSTDSGDNWISVTSNSILGSETVWAIAVFPNSQKIFVNSTYPNMLTINNALSLNNTLFTNIKTLNINANTSITGSVNITGSLLVSGSITGLINSASYAITASFVRNVASSSHSLTSSYTPSISGSDGYISKFLSSDKIIPSIMKEISPAIWTYGNQTITGSISIGKELTIEGTGSNVLTGDLIVNKFNVKNLILSSSLAVPTSITSSGEYGQILFNNNFIYVCTGSNSWKRAGINTW